MAHDSDDDWYEDEYEDEYANWDVCIHGIGWDHSCLACEEGADEGEKDGLP